MEVIMLNLESQLVKPAQLDTTEIIQLIQQVILFVQQDHTVHKEIQHLTLLINTAALQEPIVLKQNSHLQVNVPHVTQENTV